MSNGNVVYRNRPKFKTPATNPLALAKHTGFTDYMCGNGFCNAYDSWDKVSQCNYETGRKLAAIMSRYTSEPIRWAKHQKLSTVRKSIVPTHLWDEFEHLVRAEQDMLHATP